MQFVSDIKKNKPLFIWLGITVFCMAFAFIYELFSFGVYSMNMILMFLYPLLLGALPCLIFKRHMGRFFNDGILLLTGASLLAGVLEIYGTTSMMTGLMWWLGIVFLCLGLLVPILQKRHRT